MTLECLLISVFLPVFVWCDHKIVLQIKTKQFYDNIMQKPVKSGKYTEINKQSNVKFWLNWINYGAVSYSLSCTKHKSFPWIDPLLCKSLTNFTQIRTKLHNQILGIVQQANCHSARKPFVAKNEDLHFTQFFRKKRFQVLIWANLKTLFA